MCSTVCTQTIASVILITRWLDLFLGMLMFYNVALLLSGKSLKSVFAFLFEFSHFCWHSFKSIQISVRMNKKFIIHSKFFSNPFQNSKLIPNSFWIPLKSISNHADASSFIFVYYSFKIIHLKRNAPLFSAMGSCLKLLLVQTKIKSLQYDLPATGLILFQELFCSKFWCVTWWIQSLCIFHQIIMRIE